MLKRVSVSLVAIAALIGIGRVLILAQELPPAEKTTDGAKEPFIPAVKKTAPAVSPKPTPETPKIPGTDPIAVGGSSGNMDMYRDLMSRTDPTRSADEIKVFSLANANAQDSLDLIKLVAPSVKCSADVRTNSVVAVGNAEALSVVEAVLLRMDEQPTLKDPRPANAPKPEYPVNAELPLRDQSRQNFFSGFALGLSVKPHSKVLLDELSKLESKAIAQAERIRDASKGALGGEADIAALRSELDQILAEALRVKFQLESQQVEALEERLNRVKSQMSKRTAATKEIIDRRARELIDDDRSRWNTGDPSVDPATAGRLNQRFESKAQTMFGVDAFSTFEDSLVPRPNTDPRNRPIPPPRSSDMTNRLTTNPDSGWESGPSRLANQLSAAEQQWKKALDEVNEARVAKDDKAVPRLSELLRSAQEQLRIARAEFTAARQDLEFQYEAAQVALQAAQVRVDRLRKLGQSGAVSTLTLDESQSTLQREKLLRDRLKLRLDHFKTLRLNATTPAKDDIVLPSNFDLKLKPETGGPGTDSGFNLVPQSAPAQEPSPFNQNNAPKDTEPKGSRGIPVDPNSLTVPPRTEEIAVPATLQSLGKAGLVLAKSRNPHEVASMIREISFHGDGADAQQRMTALIAWTDRFVEEDLKSGNLSPFVNTLIPATKEVDPAIRAKVFLKLLQDGGIPVQWTVVKCLSPVWELSATDDFPALCEELWKLESSTTTVVKSAALRVLLETVPMTRPGAPEFQSAELQAMVRRLALSIPVDRIMSAFKTAMNDADLNLALEMALFAAPPQEEVPDPTVISQSINVMSQISKGKWQQVTATPVQRYRALKGLERYQSKPKVIVPVLIELLKVEKSSYGSARNQGAGTYSKEAIIHSLGQFGAEAKAALPLIEDELILISARPADGSGQYDPTLASAVAPGVAPLAVSPKDRLLKTIKKIKSDEAYPVSSNPKF